ncbi:MAG: M20 family metallopeptidase [Bdellovibrionales bacterium]
MISQLRTFFTMAGLALLSSTVGAAELNSGFLDNLLNRLGAFYQDLHKHPELSLKETRTSQKMAAEYRRLGLTTTEKVGGTGVVGVLTNGPGPIGMVRADMDGLPVQEETGLPYASENAGVMHACGHDLHMSIQVGLIEALQAHRNAWSGTMVFIAQPAEEVGAGAKAMLEDGLFDRFPRPEYSLALHVDPGYPTGTVATRSGPMMASADMLDVEFHGKGGHAAKPHLTVDPVVLGAEYVLKLRSLTSDEVDPLQPTVLNVGSFHAGTKHNIIPDSAKLHLNMRTFDPDTRDFLVRRVQETATELSRAHRADGPTVTHVSSTPSLANDPSLVEMLNREIGQLDGVHLVTKPMVMTAEDYARYHRDGGVPGAMFLLGSQNPQTPEPWPGSHTSRYAPDYGPTIRVGIRSMYAAVTAMQKPAVAKVKGKK